MALRLDKKLEFTPEMRQLAMRLGAGLLLLAAAAYVLLLLPLQERARLDSETAAAREGIERQRLLMPSWASISSASQNATLSAFLPPNPEPVPRTRVYLMPEQLAHMARALGVEPLDVTLNAASLGQDPTSIQVQGVFSGQVNAVRALLMSLGGMPSLGRMERVELRAVDGRLELFLQLRIALAN